MKKHENNLASQFLKFTAMFNDFKALLRLIYDQMS